VRHLDKLLRMTDSAKGSRLMLPTVLTLALTILGPLRARENRLNSQSGQLWVWAGRFGPEKGPRWRTARPRCLIQGQVGQEGHTSSDLEQKRAAVNKLEAAVLRKPQPLKRSA